MNIIILGPQGSGKGTQANLLRGKLKLPHLDVGQMLRDEVQKCTTIGKKIKSILEKGELIPNTIAPNLLKQRLKNADCKDGFILDGFPRDIAQVKLLERLTIVDVVIELKVSDTLALKRLTNRLQCTKCSTIYGVDFPPKKKGLCDKCSGRLVHRSDDTPVLVKKRLQIYHKSTEPVINYFKGQNKVISIDASQPPKQVHQEILRRLK